MKPIAITIPEACHMSGYSRSELYRRMTIGEIEAVKIGRSVRVLVDSLERSIASLPRAKFTAPREDAA